MTDGEKEAFVLGLEEEYLKGGVILSEWANRISCDATEAFVNGQHLAALLTAIAAIETHLRSEYGDSKMRLQELIENASIDEELKIEINALRRYRNRWVHVAEPWGDDALLDKPELIDDKLLNYSMKTIRAMFRVLFCEQWV